VLTLLEPISLVHKGKFVPSTPFACALPQDRVMAALFGGATYEFLTRKYR
jgi:hypothetical protein